MRKGLLIFFLLTGSLYAELRPTPGCWGLAGEWMLWRASIDHPYFVNNSNVDVVLVGERVPNHQSWHHGYRIESLYRFCNGLTDARIRWSHIPRFNDSVTTTGFIDAVFALPDPTTAGVFGRAEWRQDFNVFYLDAVLGHSLFNASYFRFVFQAGLQYGYARLNEEAVFITPDGAVSTRTVITKSSFSGIGPELGIDFSYDLLRWLHFTGRASTAILASERKSSLTDNGTLPPSDIHNGKYWSLMPTTNLRLGMSFRAPFNFTRLFDCSPLAGFSCLKLDLEVGYEVMSFYKAFDRLFYTDDISLGSSTEELIDLTFHGPYVHLGITF